jgi:hypothetical protein
VTGTDPSAPTVFRGGPVLTMTDGGGPCDVVVVEAGRIVEVGGRELADAVLSRATDATVVELEGRTLAPGFIDAHCHLSIAALEPEWVDCTDVVEADLLVERLRRQLQDRPGLTWARADRWDETVTGFGPDRAMLDAAAGDTPAIVVHQTFHQGVVNSAGLDALGIGRRTGVGGGADEDGIERDPRGEPTGLLIERAFGRAHTASMAPYTDPDRWPGHVADRARLLLRHGVTAVHDAAVDPPAEAMYRSMAAAGTLPLSVLMLPHPSPFLSNTFGDRLDGPPTADGDEWLRVGPLKLFADGGVAPAIDVHLDGHHIELGRLFDDLHDAVAVAVDRGFRVAVHAMGNAGIAATLDAFEAAARRRPTADHRFRLEHAGLASCALARRAAAIGAVGVVQPGFVDHVGRSTAGFEPDDATWLPFATLADAGVVLAGSSDDPCGPNAPLHCAALGRSRQTGAGLSIAPSESVPFEDWLRAYTAGAAHAGGQEDERGSIRPGLRADLVVLEPTASSDEPFRVSETWVAGERVHRA